MLKRQRPASPPIPSSSVPVVSDTPADLIERHTKRRRTLPPVLDGSHRGWATEPRTSADDEDEYYSDDEEDEQESDFQRQQQQLQSEYKSTNNMLRELHTLHQHRLLFSPQATSDTRASPLTVIKPYQHQQLLQSPIKGLMPHLSERLQTPQQQLTSTSTPARIDSTKRTHTDPLSEELTRVSERYESTNRYVTPSQTISAFCGPCD
uniref:Uncharacterized protein n=1 Tax=Psilocybe cubensis TaxID=181762 RepID=A0A8H7YBW7_PSICU